VRVRGLPDRRRQGGFTVYRALERYGAIKPPGKRGGQGSLTPRAS